MLYSQMVYHPCLWMGRLRQHLAPLSLAGEPSGSYGVGFVRLSEMEVGSVPSYAWLTVGSRLEFAVLAHSHLCLRSWGIWRRNRGKQLPAQIRYSRMSYIHTKARTKDTGEYQLRQARLSRRRPESAEPYSYTSLPWPSP